MRPSSQQHSRPASARQPLARLALARRGADAPGRIFLLPVESWVAVETVAAMNSAPAAKITLFTAGHPPRSWMEAPAAGPSTLATASRHPPGSRRGRGRVHRRDRRLVDLRHLPSSSFRHIKRGEAIIVLLVKSTSTLASARIISRLPSRAAWCSSVEPSELLAFGFAPASSRIATASSGLRLPGSRYGGAPSRMYAGPPVIAGPRPPVIAT